MTELMNTGKNLLDGCHFTAMNNTRFKPLVNKNLLFCILIWHEELNCLSITTAYHEIQYSGSKNLYPNTLLDQCQGTLFLQTYANCAVLHSFHQH